jgi:hypothetical protein
MTTTTNGVDINETKAQNAPVLPPPSARLHSISHQFKLIGRYHVIQMNRS